MHRAEHPGFEDGDLRPGRGVSASGWVCSLAYLKAWVKSCDAGPEVGLVLGADTACSLDGALIGTPLTAGEARQMIRAFMGREHGVVTGVALLERRGDRACPRRWLFSDWAKVSMGVLDDRTLEEYLESGAWEGKAGGYNLLDRIDAGWPLTYEGDATTVMGLPMQKLLSRLRLFGRSGGG